MAIMTYLSLNIRIESRSEENHEIAHPPHCSFDLRKYERFMREEEMAYFSPPDNSHYCLCCCLRCSRDIVSEGRCCLTNSTITQLNTMEST